MKGKASNGTKNSGLMATIFVSMGSALLVSIITNYISIPFEVKSLKERVNRLDKEVSELWKKVSYVEGIVSVIRNFTDLGKNKKLTIEQLSKGIQLLSSDRSKAEIYLKNELNFNPDEIDKVFAPSQDIEDTRKK